MYLGELTGLVKFISSTNFFKVSEMTLSPDKLESFRTLLNQKINELLEDAGKTVADMTDSKENYPDPTDRASLESDRIFELRMRDRV